MFSKILIANRGEIACRVIRTARAMGIKTVAVYSEPDADARHVREANEAVPIGPAAAVRSYLSVEDILAAVRQTGAEAVHPGYGFLSENPELARALKDAGVAFIGPSPEAIAAMGDKIESKRLAAAAGVSTVPGYLGVISDADQAVAIAREIGYPVMIKASAGGGGKGMRVAADDAAVRSGFRSAVNEARASFGDDRVFIEKFIEEPRHIEIQILADAYGNTIHLGERECSIQRRHQKVIEESPSPFLDAETREAMGAQAVALARAVGYRSAGTVEFILDASRNFYFLEMNTRLQVEHPVTELVTGIDLVEQMIRIAAGEPLTIRQADVAQEGWAIEARIYAEDPARNFLPSTGRLTRYREPPPSPSVRIDTGVYEGAEITVFYDPMIAKLITYGGSRDQALAAMRHALDRFYIRGVSHNLSFLAAVARHPRFAEGRLSTEFIAEAFPDGFAGAKLEPDLESVFVAIAAVAHDRIHARDAQISGRLHPAASSGGRNWVVLRRDGSSHLVTVTEAPGGHVVEAGGVVREVVSGWQVGQPIFDADIDGEAISVQIDRKGVGYRLSSAGAEVDLRVLHPRAAELAALMPVKQPPDLSRFLLSPMPGLLVSLAVTEGQVVSAGQELAVVEAMKMENLLRAERDGRIAVVHAAPGDSLAVDQAILEFE